MIEAVRSGETKDAAAKALAEVVAGAIGTKLIMATIGEIALVFAHAPTHRGDTLADLLETVAPAAASKQAYVVERMDPASHRIVPVAVATWAFVSPAVDARLTRAVSGRLRLAAPEWTSGDIAWLVDLVGEAPAIRKAVDWLLAGPFKTRPAKIAARDAQGRYSVRTLSEFSAT